MLTKHFIDGTRAALPIILANRDLRFDLPPAGLFGSTARLLAAGICVLDDVVPGPGGKLRFADFFAKCFLAQLGDKTVRICLISINVNTTGIAASGIKTHHSCSISSHRGMCIFNFSAIKYARLQRTIITTVQPKIMSTLIVSFTDSL